MGDHHGAPEAAFHAFMTVNLVGGAIGAPILARWAERLQHPGRLLTILCVLDGLLLLACIAPMPVSLLLGVRSVQGAANLGGLSLIMGAATRGPADGGRSVGGVGAAVMVGVAAGAPLGTLALGLGPWGPALVGGFIQLLVAVGTLRLAGWTQRPVEPTGGAPGHWRPALWVAVERFGVGALVVSFALYARQVHGLSDAWTGRAFAWFMVPFVGVVYPATRLAHEHRRTLVVVGGLAVYGLSLASLGVLDVALLPLAMLVCGVASAFVYGASLRAAVHAVAPEQRSRAMASLNAAGGVGMLVGTAGAGILTTVWRAAGGEPSVVYPALFALIGVCQWLAALSAVARQPLAQRGESPGIAPQLP